MTAPLNLAAGIGVAALGLGAMTMGPPQNSQPLPSLSVVPAVSAAAPGSVSGSFAPPSSAEPPPRRLIASQGLTAAPSIGSPSIGAEDGAGLPQVFAPSRPRTRYTRYPWKEEIIATVFWIGEKPTARNPTPNHMSAWDMKWQENFGGYDNPSNDARDGFLPKDFEPGLNPFYIALPYNDMQRGGGTKASARAVIPWYDREFERAGKTIIRGRWVAIRRGRTVCYAQWEDVGPFETDDWQYVFGDARPKTKGNGGAGIDISPAVRDYLGMTTNGPCDWRFVDEEEVPDGPWKRWGANNPFVDPEMESSGDGSIVTLGDEAEEFLGDLPTGAE